MDEWTFLNGEGFFGGITGIEAQPIIHLAWNEKVIHIGKAVRWVKSNHQSSGMLYSPADQPTQLQLSLPPCFLS